MRQLCFYSFGLMFVAFNDVTLADVSCHDFVTFELKRANLGTLQNSAECVDKTSADGVVLYSRLKECTGFGKPYGYVMPGNDNYAASAMRIKKNERSVETFFSLGKTISSDEDEDRLQNLPKRIFWLDLSCKITRVQFGDGDSLDISKCNGSKFNQLLELNANKTAKDNYVGCRDLITNYKQFITPGVESRGRVKEIKDVK